MHDAMSLPIHVRSSFSNKEGTWVVKDHPEGGEMEAAIIAGIAHDKSEAKVTIVGVPDRAGMAAAIFQAIADADINIDMIVQNVSAAATGLTDISFHAYQKLKEQMRNCCVKAHSR